MTKTPKQESIQQNTTQQDPMHGVTLKMVVTQLEEKYGWEELGNRINIKCFTNDPSISSSLKFLRRTLWAREKVEKLYLQTDWDTKNVWPKNWKG